MGLDNRVYTLQLHQQEPHSASGQTPESLDVYMGVFVCGCMDPIYKFLPFVCVGISALSWFFFFEVRRLR